MNDYIHMIEPFIGKEEAKERLPKLENALNFVHLVIIVSFIVMLLAGYFVKENPFDLLIGAFAGWAIGVALIKTIRDLIKENGRPRKPTTSTTFFVEEGVEDYRTVKDSPRATRSTEAHREHKE